MSKQDDRFSDVGDDWSRPWKISRVLDALGMEVPDRLRRERLSKMLTNLRAIGLEATLADHSSLEDKPPSIDAKIRLRRVGEEAQLLFSKYDVVERLPDGGMSECFKVRDREDGGVYFLKRVAVADPDSLNLARELALYAKLQRREAVNVLQLHAVERTSEHVGLVTEFASGGSLETYVRARGKLSGKDAKLIAVQVLEGLRELHSLEVVHRDLKPANVLLAGGRWKLGDFGISKDLARPFTRGTYKQCGTRGYAATEQWDGPDAHPSADVAAFGALLAFLLTASPDVSTLDEPEWGPLARRCRQHPPDSRPSLEDVAAELERL